MIIYWMKMNVFMKGKKKILKKYFDYLYLFFLNLR